MHYYCLAIIYWLKITLMTTIVTAFNLTIDEHQRFDDVMTVGMQARQLRNIYLYIKYQKL